MAKDKTKKVLESEEWAWEFNIVRHEDVRDKIDESTPYMAKDKTKKVLESEEWAWEFNIVRHEPASKLFGADND